MLTKIKHHKGETEIWWKDQNSQSGELIEHKLVCSEPPRQELVAALNGFAGYVIDLCELPPDYAVDLTVTGVSISESEAMGTGIVVTSLKKITKANAPVVINTPHLSQDASCDGGPKWPKYVQGLLLTLEREAELYRNGRRAQGELALETKEEPIAEASESGMSDAEVKAYFKAHQNDDPLMFPQGASVEQCERILEQLN